MHLVFINLEGREHSTGVNRRRRAGAATLLAGGGGDRGNDTFLSNPFSPCDQSKLRKLQACHQIHLGPQLLVPKRVPSSGWAVRGWWIQPRCPGLSFLPTCLLPFPDPVHPSLSPTHMPLPFASSCSSSLPFLVHSTCLKKKTI